MANHRKFGAALGLLLLFVFAAPATAAIHQITTSCGEFDLANTDPQPFVCMSEDGNMKGDKLILTSGTDAPDFATAPSHDLPGICGFFQPEDGWNDCISDVYAVLPPGWCLRGYEDRNYLGPRTFAISNLGSSTIIWNSPTLFGAANDATSSVVVRLC